MNDAPPQPPALVDRLSQLVTDDRLLTLSFVVLAFHHFEMVTRTPVAFGAVGFALVGVVAGEARVRVAAGLVAALGAVQVLMMPWNVPNHLVVATFLALSLAISAVDGDRWELRARQAHGLLVVILAMATLQKLLSPTYLDGQYLTFMTSVGGWAHGLPAWLDPTAPFEHNIRSVNWTMSGGEGRSLVAVPYLGASRWLLLGSTLALEAFLVALLVVFRQRRNVFGGAAMFFVLGTAMLRAEFVFLSLMSLLCAWALQDSDRWRAAFSAVSVMMLGLWLVVVRLA